MRRLALLLGLALLVGCATPTGSKPKEYLVSHILCADEHAANQALNRILAGEPFELVAQDVSIDPGTQNKGGRIAHWTAADSWSPKFASEVKRLKVGQMADRPVSTEFGWHVVRADSAR